MVKWQAILAVFVQMGHFFLDLDSSGLGFATYLCSDN
jgi:hypothetical protein